MVKPGKKYQEAYVLSQLKGKEILVIRSDDEYSQKAMVELDSKMRSENPEWTGTLLVLRTDQTIEKMPEQMAFALYHALKKCFDPMAADAPPTPVIDEPNTPASETAS